MIARVGNGGDFSADRAIAHGLRGNTGNGSAGTGQIGQNAGIFLEFQRQISQSGSICSIRRKENLVLDILIVDPITLRVIDSFTSGRIGEIASRVARARDTIVRSAPRSPVGIVGRSTQLEFDIRSSSECFRPVEFLDCDIGNIGVVAGRLKGLSCWIGLIIDSEITESRCGRGVCCS